MIVTTNENGQERYAVRCDVCERKMLQSRSKDSALDDAADMGWVEIEGRHCCRRCQYKFLSDAMQELSPSPVQPGKRKG